MTETDLSQTLWIAVTEILEKMFFIDPSEIEDDGSDSKIPADRGGLTAHLNFDGDPPGWLRLRLTRDVASSLAADFLGEDESELAERKVEGVACELANMICGSVLSRVESTTDFRLAAPEITSPDVVPPRPAICSRTVPLRGGLLSVEMAMENIAWPASVKPVS